MFAKLSLVFLSLGILSNLGAMALNHMAVPDFYIGFLEGMAIALLGGGLCFFVRVRKTGEKADCIFCRRDSSLCGETKREEDSDE